jgi:pyridinium-3,5-bisthiocarboxylic acid mononucleotide nickel chelatase
VTVVAPPEREALSRLLFRETTTIGVRYQEMSRECLERETVDVETPFGRALQGGAAGRRVLNARPSSTTAPRWPPSGVPVKDVQARRACQGLVATANRSDRYFSSPCAST